MQIDVQLSRGLQVTAAIPNTEVGVVPPTLDLDFTVTQYDSDWRYRTTLAIVDDIWDDYSWFVTCRGETTYLGEGATLNCEIPKWGEWDITVRATKASIPGGTLTKTNQNSFDPLTHYVGNYCPFNYKVAFALFKIYEGATNCVTLKRASDGAEEIIGFDPLTNWVDIAAADLFEPVAANRQVVKLWCQAPESNHMVETVITDCYNLHSDGGANNRPRLVLNSTSTSRDSYVFEADSVNGLEPLQTHLMNARTLVTMDFDATSNTNNMGRFWRTASNRGALSLTSGQISANGSNSAFIDYTHHYQVNPDYFGYEEYWANGSVHPAPQRFKSLMIMDSPQNIRTVITRHNDRCTCSENILENSVDNAGQISALSPVDGYVEDTYDYCWNYGGTYTYEGYNEDEDRNWHYLMVEHFGSDYDYDWKAIHEWRADDEVGSFFSWNKLIEFAHTQVGAMGYTVAIQFKHIWALDDITGGDQQWYFGNGASNNHGARIDVQDGVPHFLWEFNGGNNTWHEIPLGAWNDRDWNQIVFIYDQANDRCKIRINGVDTVDGWQTTGTPSTTDLYLGYFLAEGSAGASDAIYVTNLGMWTEPLEGADLTNLEGVGAVRGSDWQSIVKPAHTFFRCTKPHANDYGGVRRTDDSDPETSLKWVFNEGTDGTHFELTSEVDPYRWHKKAPDPSLVYRPISI